MAESMPKVDSPMANAIRFLSIDAIVRAQEGHQGVPLGMAEISTALFGEHMRFNPQDPLWPDRDRFVLSNGHGSMLLYSLLYLTGYEKVSLDEIKRFRALGSVCAGHPEYDPEAGIEITTGLLGQGIGNAMGMAVAEAYQRARFGAELVNHYTYAFVGDGCLQEGVGQEMISLAGHLGLGHLILLWDDNKITDDGSTELSISEDVGERFRVANWHVVEVNGHDVAAVSAAISEAKQEERPSMIACRTVIGRGIPRLQGQRGGHSARLFDEDAQAAREELNWPHAPFEIPAQTLAQWRVVGQRSSDEYHSWNTRLNELPVQERAEWDRIQSSTLPHNWQAVLQEYKQRVISEGDAKAGIFSSAEINDLFADLMPERLVGCADLEAPTSHKRSLKAFTAQDNAGSYIHCGVREHLMGAMANGMAAHGGVLPLAVTYLAFSDYERPAMRMAALMGMPTKFVFSHDSIGLGRNGPTHQPVEIIASLRAMPNMYVFRPADAVEAAESWEVAMELTRSPSSMIFARQELPLVRHHANTENLVARGAYVLKESTGRRQVTLLATGSEVAIALEASQYLESEGIEAAVVSMPCWELFDQQPLAYRQQVLGEGTLRVGIEAATRFGWDQYIGMDGIFVGMTGFGLSGPANELYERFGITSAAVVEQVKLRVS